jgi:hypothetical protein
VSQIYHNIRCPHHLRRPQGVSEDSGLKHTPFCAHIEKKRPDDFCVPAWLCTQVNEVRFQSAITIKPGKSRMTKQESAALNMAKFIRAQSLLLLEKLDVLDLDDEAADCERMHEQAEALYQKLSARFGIQDGE